MSSSRLETTQGARAMTARPRLVVWASVWAVWFVLLQTTITAMPINTNADRKPRESKKNVKPSSIKPVAADDRYPSPEQITALSKRVEELSQQVEALTTKLAFTAKPAEDLEARRKIADLETRLKNTEERAAAAEQFAVTLRDSVKQAEPSEKPIAPKAQLASSVSISPNLDYQNATKPETQEAAPLSLHIGSASITPIGFMDFTAVFRSTNGGSGIGTNFGSIPFNNTTAGKLTETRLSAQNSRIGLRVDAKVKDANVIGYLESDFLGVVPGNVAVSSNSDSLRMRVYWADVRKGKFEVMGGQSWSMLTPGRKGISPLPGDLFYTQNIDVNYQAGLVWSRDPQFRFVYHPSDSVALGISLENPEQYIGGSAGGGLVTLPTALVTPYANQLSNGSTSLAAPNLHPDVIAKIAFDSKVADRDFHLEASGVVRSFKLYNPVNQTPYTTTGGGGSLNFNLELVKNLRLVSNNFYSDGGGRWIFGQAPDLIVRGDGSASLIHSGSTVSGIEVQAHPNTMLYGYYGGVYIQRNVAIDPSNGKPVGYGYSGSPSGQNRSIHEATFGFTQTLWRDPKYGALQLMGQYSYLIRHPWAVAAGQPDSAQTNMVFLNLRYLLPGSAPKVK